MNEIKCPKCGEVFTIDEASYASIVKQVRDDEFNAEIRNRELNYSREKESALRLAKAESDKILQEQLSKKDSLIQELQSRLEQKDSERELAITKAVAQKDAQLGEKQIEISRLTSAIESSKNQYALQEKTIKEGFETQLRLRDEEIERLKDFKAKQSTKMVGESLEQFCYDEFNKIRMTAFPTAYFEKDNDARSGSKGDFIYRECDENGVELISIMFEMKNEMETTATKHKNEDFFKELDKDRREKNCEYAVLVSLLEADSDYYNAGIVDVSYQYEKMYVVRPQCFIPIITLLRNASLNSLKYKQQMEVMRNQNIDITNFEASLNDFKNDFAYNVDQAHKRFDEAIKGIDDTMNKLQKIRDALTKSDDQLRRANNKVEAVSIKKLTKGNPTMAAKFDELKNN
ncbi:DUF2130 domain-containing protein [uncultured Eubacterium sp.]|uniref:DUF2130 domain-containing protein n=1 Tax=uncultured Eubacterium sp. TaxID=165185 RepID=UPI0015BA2900|nr:DUF2130 domain-containing protein [uncultured Eubacterium sp.]